MVKIWFESHATSIDNEAKRASGWNDIDLSEQGLKQAEEMVARNRDRNLHAILCSDLQRAIKTARPSANALHVPIYIDQRLRECNYGKLTQEPGALIEEQRLQRIKEPFPDGESYEQCLERMEKFFTWLRTAFDGQTVLIIGHRATHYGIEHFGLGRSLTDCINEHWQWQPGWYYEIQ